MYGCDWWVSRTLGEQTNGSMDCVQRVSWEEGTGECTPQAPEVHQISMVQFG